MGTSRLHRPQRSELGLPVAEHVRPDADDLSDLADLEEELVWQLDLGHALVTRGRYYAMSLATAPAMTRRREASARYDRSPIGASRVTPGHACEPARVTRSLRALHVRFVLRRLAGLLLGRDLQRIQYVLQHLAGLEGEYATRADRD